MNWFKKLFLTRCSREVKLYKMLYRDALLQNKRYQKLYEFVRNHESLVYTHDGTQRVTLDVRKVDDIIISLFTEDELKEVDWITEGDNK